MLKERIRPMRGNELFLTNKQNLPKRDWPVGRPVLANTNSTNQELLSLLEKADPTNKDDLERVSTLLDKIWSQPVSDKGVIEKAQAFIRTAHQFQSRSRWEG